MKIVYGCLILLLTSCATQKKAADQSIKDIEWIVGDWEYKTEQKTFRESWDLENDSTLVGEGIIYQGGEILFSEDLRIEKRKDGVYYVANIGTQNLGKSVEFKLTKSSKHQLVFQNQKHDFPQKINYTLTAPHSLLAVISGKAEGRSRTEQFAFQKME